MFPITMSNSASASDDLERQNITDNRRKSVNSIKFHAFSLKKTNYMTYLETAKSSPSKFCISTMFSLAPSRSLGFYRKFRQGCLNKVTKTQLAFLIRSDHNYETRLADFRKLSQLVEVQVHGWPTAALKTPGRWCTIKRLDMWSRIYFQFKS